MDSIGRTFVAKARTLANECIMIVFNFVRLFIYFTSALDDCLCAVFSVVPAW